MELTWLRRQSPATRLLRLQQAAALLMKHVRLSGRCECLRTRDADGREGYLLQITTPQNVPFAERDEFQRYFSRKLAQFGELDGQPLLLLIRDAEDLRIAAKPRAEVSSVRIAAIIAGANQPPEREDVETVRRVRLRDELRERVRREPDIGSEPMPLEPPPLTDMGALSSR